MKNLNLVVVVSSVIFMASGLAQASDGTNVGHQNLSKRPYQQLPEESAHNATEGWEGATLVKDEGNVKNQPTDYQRLRINMLSKQPYMEGKVE